MASHEQPRLPRRMPLTDAPHEIARLIAPGGVWSVNDQQCDLLAHRLGDGLPDRRRSRLRWHGSQALVLLERKRRVQVYETVHAAHARLASKPAAQVVQLRDPRPRERRALTVIEDDDDARVLLLRELPLHERRATPRLRVGR